MVTTILILRQMKEDNGVQRDYYEKTVRPFVYIEDIKLEDYGFDEQRHPAHGRYTSIAR